MMCVLLNLYYSLTITCNWIFIKITIKPVILKQTDKFPTELKTNSVCAWLVDSLRICLINLNDCDIAICWQYGDWHSLYITYYIWTFWFKLYEKSYILTFFCFVFESAIYIIDTLFVIDFKRYVKSVCNLKLSVNYRNMI